MRRPDRLLRASHVQRDTRDIGKRRRPSQGLAQLRPDVERLPTRRERVVVLRCHIALLRVEPQELGAFRQRQPVGEPQRTCVLRGGLSMRAERARARSGGRREHKHRVGVVRRLRVMGEPSEVGRGLRRRPQGR